MGKIKDLTNVFQHVEGVCWEYVFDHSLLLMAGEPCTLKPLENEGVLPEKDYTVCPPCLFGQLSVSWVQPRELE